MSPLVLSAPAAVLPPGAGLCLPLPVCPSQIIDAGGGLASSVAGQAASSVLDAVSTATTQAAGWAAGQVMSLITTTTDPSVGQGWFALQVGMMQQVALLLVLPVLLVASVGPVLRQDARRLARVWAVGLPVAVLAGMLSAQLVAVGLQATDAMCALVTGPGSRQLGAQFVTAIGRGAVAGTPLFFQMVVALITLAGAVAVWLELTVRSAGVLVACFFMPLVLVSYIWPATAGLARRAAEILVALVLSKFVILAALHLGVAALAHGGVESPLSGAAILLMAAFAPFALLRLAPVVEASAIAHLEGMSRRPGRAVARAATAAAGAPVHPVTQLVMSAASNRSGGGGPDGGVRPVAAQHIPDATASYRPASPSTGPAADA